MLSDFDKDLPAYFTDFEKERDGFKNSISAPTLTKRLLIIHGVAGIGKSSLLRMFYLHCKSVNVPVALALGEEAKSALDILARWTDDLKADGIALPSFGKTFEQYRAILSKVDEQTKKNLEVQGRTADIAGKAASKTSEAVSGILLGAAIGSVIPGIGTAIGSALGGILSRMGAEAMVDWLRSQGFAKPDIDLLLDPLKRLTDDFLSDIDKIAPKRRIVLMIDTYEKMIVLQDWTCNLAQRLSPNLFLVIAGRGMPNWDHRWVGWSAQANVEEIELRPPNVMRELAHRYYKTITNSELDPAKTEEIIQFARGLPIAITNTVDLMVKYHTLNFQAMLPKVITDLAQRLQEGIPDNLKPALQAAATLRLFDEPSLRAVMQKSDVSMDYDELQRFPFIVLHNEQFALHDVVRETLDANFRARDPELYLEWHKRAAVYYERRLSQSTVDEAWGLGLEFLFHSVCADEEAGIMECEETAEGLVRYRRIGNLQALMDEAKTYTLQKIRSLLWRDYFNSRLQQLKTQVSHVNWLHKTIGEKTVEPVSEGPVENIIEYDVFISHAWEDKPFARDLAEVLRKKRLKVWYDEFTLSVGDSLRRSIDRGLANSRYGIVILSLYFFTKEWPQKELDGLVSRETLGKKIILPVWHNITTEQVRKYSPILADRIAVTTDKGLDQVVTELLRAMHVY